MDATYYLDSDGDGYGNVNVSQIACSQPTGYVLSATDCNDSEVTANPLAVRCDGIDNDCNGVIDESVELTFIWITIKMGLIPTILSTVVVNPS